MSRFDRFDWGNRCLVCEFVEICYIVGPMFTGIIQDQGRVVYHAKQRIAVLSDLAFETDFGDSIAVDGVCLTVSDIDDDMLYFDVMPETLKRTTLGMLKKDSLVNLETSLKVGDRLGGHFVTGHVDTIGTVIGYDEYKGSHIMTVAFNEKFGKYIVPRASIAINGVSLTVNCLLRDLVFTVSLVPFTVEMTNLSMLDIGDSVNLEIDVIARYLERYKELAVEQPKPSL